MADMLKFDKESEDETQKSPDGAGDAADKSQRRYSSEEVADIIRLSLQEEAGSPDNTIDHEELLSIGKEVGVSGEQIDQAVHLLEEQQQTRDKEKFLWQRFKAHSAIFITVNLLCILLNLITGPEVFWAGYMLLGWGLFLLGHYAGLRYAPEFVEMAMERTRLIAGNKYQEYFDDDVNVGFTVNDSSGMLSSVGLVFLEDDHLKVEHQTADAVLGLLKTGVKETDIALVDIVTAKLEPKLWSNELVLQSKSLKTFRHLPGTSTGVLRLKINRQSNTAAQNLVVEINRLKQE